MAKTAPASATPADLGRIDVVLLSHDEHDDNLDTSGRALLADVPLTLTTPSGAGGWAAPHAPEGLGVHRAGPPRRRHDHRHRRPGPARSRARADLEPVVGEVVGFVLSGDGLPTVYISGDNAQLSLVREIAERFGPVDTAVLFAGAVRTPVLDRSLLTLDSAQAAEAARILGARRIVPVHFDSWAHFTEGRDELVAAFAGAGLTNRVDFGVRG
ncbi:MBL fold metallo-hydrolase [Streptomyces sp. M10(2022)]